MKSLFRILIVLTFLGIVFYYSSTEPKPLKGPEREISEVENVEDIEYNSEMLQRPSSGISEYIGKSVKELISDFDEPDRIDQTPYDYEWWVYNQYETYVMFAVKENVITQVYTNSTAYDIAPYNMYMSADDIYRMTIVDGEISVEINDNVYLFSMNNEDMKYRILVQFEDLYAQLYIDSQYKKLIGIRFMDGESLVTNRAYEMQFVGENPIQMQNESTELTNKAYAEQLFELTNVFRLKEKLPTFAMSTTLSEIASVHSMEMFEGEFVSHNSPTKGSLKQRVSAYNLQFEDVDENIATGYFDAIEAIHSLLNSNQHRKFIYEEKFKEMGVGVHDLYYTQIFLNPKVIEQ